MAKDGGIGDLLYLGVLIAGGYLVYTKRGQIMSWINSITPSGGGTGGGGSTGGGGGSTGGGSTGGGGTGTGTGGGTKGGGTKGGGTSGGGGVSSGANISFCAAGDWGSGRSSNWKGVVAEMQKLKPKVVLVPGDMSYKGVPEFKPVTDAIKKFATVIGAQGNHDSGSYGGLFNGGYSNSYHNIGNCSFMALNSNSPGSAISFFKANASKMTQKWKVVFFHHPVYTVKSDHNEMDMKSIQPELTKAHVQLCIAAHNHTYQRFAPKGGVTHVLSGLGGEGPYPIGANCGGCPALVKKYNSKFGTFYANATATAMNCKFVAVGGGVIDSFNIT